MSEAPQHLSDDDDKIPRYLSWAQFAVTAVILGAIGSLAYMAGFTSSKGHGAGEAAATAAAPAVTADVSTLIVETPELIAHGKSLFQVNCVTCHGPGGAGDGAAAAALNPKPRNFTSDQGWKFGSGVARIARTLSEGSPGTAMAAFQTIPMPDRIALAHFVRSLNPNPDVDKQADLDWLGVGKPGAAAGGAAAASATAAVAGPTISIEKALSLLTEAAPKAGAVTATTSGDSGEGARLYATRCASCHGAAGQGGIRVRMLGSAPYAYVETRSLGDPTGDWYSNPASFDRHVLEGLPGVMMPGNGDLSRGSLRELYSFTQSLRARQEAAGRGRSS